MDKPGFLNDFNDIKNCDIQSYDHADLGREREQDIGSV